MEGQVGFLELADSCSVALLLILCVAAGSARIEEDKGKYSSHSLAAGETPPRLLLGTQRKSSGHCCSPATSAAGCSPFWAAPRVAGCMAVVGLFAEFRF